MSADASYYPVPAFPGRFAELKACPTTYYIVVVEECATGQVVASASLIVEKKFIRQCNKVSSDIGSQEPGLIRASW